MSGDRKKGDNLKKILILSLILILTLSISFADDAKIKMDLLKYEPYPAEPGNYMNIWIRVTNEGNTEAYYPSIQFEDKYPFSLDESDERVKEVGTIAPGREIPIPSATANPALYAQGPRGLQPHPF